MINPSFPGSSEKERPVLNGEAAGSSPARGATITAVVYLYAIVRKEMTGGALLAQLGHACSECVTPDLAPLPKDTRIVVLAATKEELAQTRERLLAAGVPHAAVLETDGVLEGVVTALGLVTLNRDELKPILGNLKVWR